LGARLRPAWVRDYLLHPHQLRPNLAQTMPRLRLSLDSHRHCHLPDKHGGPRDGAVAVTPEPAQIAHGKELMTERGCVGCHQLSGAGLNGNRRRMRPVVAHARARSDLRYARERQEPGSIARWLLDPAKVKHDAAMPKLDLGLEDARDLPRFSARRARAAGARSPPSSACRCFSRRVGFDEVNEQVFG